MYDLKTVKFSDLGEVVTGKTPLTKTKEYWGGNIPFVTPADLQISKRVNDTVRKITKEGKESVKSAVLPRNSICVSCIGNIGYVSMTTKKSVTNQQINSIICSDNFDSNYVYYLMKNYESKFKNLENQSTTVSILNKTSFKNLDVEVFTNSNTQKSIADILSTFDDKIEVNSKINKNLEELAQGLYKYWFVDFEFPNKEGKPYKSSGGKMIESELGLIPENWTIQYLNEVLEFERGIEPGSKNYEETYKEHLVPFYRVGDMINQDKVVYVDKELTNNKIANVGDVFVSFDGALGRISNTLNGSYSTGIRKVFSKEKFLSNNFIYVLFQSADIQNTIKMYASGTTILHASSSIQYLSMPFNKDIVDKFTETISPIVDKIITNKIENIKLAEMRDLLLPKLMSGEIRLPIEE